MATAASKENARPDHLRFIPPFEFWYPGFTRSMRLQGSASLRGANSGSQREISATMLERGNLQRSGSPEYASGRSSLSLHNGSTREILFAGPQSAAEISVFGASNEEGGLARFRPPKQTGLDLLSC